MPQRLSESYPKARKVHRCADCHITIDVGTVYSSDSYLWDSKVYRWKTCLECDKMASDVFYWAGDPDHGIGPEEFFEWALENQKYPEAVAYLQRVGYEDPDD